MSERIFHRNIPLEYIKISNGGTQRFIHDLSYEMIKMIQDTLINTIEQFHNNLLITMITKTSPEKPLPPRPVPDPLRPNPPIRPPSNNHYN